MKLAIAGLTASGKTYQAKKLAERFGLDYISGSEVLLRYAGVSPQDEVHYWLRSGRELTGRRVRDPTIDRRTDETILEIARSRDNVIFDSWTLPWLYEGADLFRIYLAARLETRARIAYSSRTQKPFTVEEMMRLIQMKDEESRGLFEKLYGIDIYDQSVFDNVVDNSDMLPQQTTETLTGTLVIRV
ncbi:MAG: cytidylate kinase family protein [Candidatus Aenigmarchaeota archaeon]|nr:cytidylate kinase family protein [Candidatus Aenigmarchaeota archaeon]